MLLNYIQNKGGTIMAKFDKEKFKKDICEFYISNKESCDLNYNCAENNEMKNIYIDVWNKEEINSLFTMVSVVILTANKYEKNILHMNQFKKTNQQIKRIGLNLLPNAERNEATYAYFFKWRNYYVLHVHAQHTGSYTIGGSADISRYLLTNQHISPTAVISLGICFGTNENKNELCDVIISEKIYPYFIGSKITEDNYFVNDDNMFSIDQTLKRDIKSNVIETNQFNGLNYNVYMGNYITGEAVVSKKDVRDALVKHTTLQEVLAGEMEGYGVFKECNGNATTTSCLVVKGICDWAILKNFDCKKILEQVANENGIIVSNESETLKDRIQALAAYNAYNTLDILILNNIFKKSIFDIALEKIQSMTYEKIIHENRIKAIINEHTKKKLTSGIINSLVERGILIPDKENNESKNKVYTIKKGCVI